MATKSRDLCKIEKTVGGGFSGPVKIVYTFLGGLLLEGSNVEKKVTSEDEISYK